MLELPRGIAVLFDDEVGMTDPKVRELREQIAKLYDFVEKLEVKADGALGKDTKGNNPDESLKLLFLTGLVIYYVLRMRHKAQPAKDATDFAKDLTAFVKGPMIATAQEMMIGLCEEFDVKHVTQEEAILGLVLRPTGI
jgi:hypothetical protein